MNKKIHEFYVDFNKSKLYHPIMLLIILIGGIFFPTGQIIANVFRGGPFIAGPYIALVLMLFTFALYANVFLYILAILYFCFASIISFVGIGMGSIDGKEVIYFFVPIVVFLFINISTAIYTYKYKKKEL